MPDPTLRELPHELEDVLSYWLEPKPSTPEALAERKRFWFDGGDAVDREIRARFQGLVERARRGELASWSASSRGTLGLIILLDQFTRNLYRGTPEAFSHDPVSLDLARAGFDSGLFDDLDPVERMFAALPFRHAENVEDQKRGVTLAVQDARKAPALYTDYLVYSVDWARKHLDVIVRFGRFPHRNAAMRRVSTPEELEYLDYLKIAGQWL